MVSHNLTVQQWTTGEIAMEFITHRPWRKYMACLQGPHGEVKAEFRLTERQNLGKMPWGSWAKAR